MMFRPSRIEIIFLACCTSVLLTGCLAVKTPEAGAPVHLADGEGIVFGQIRIFDRGNEITPWERDLAEIFAEDPVIRLALFQVESGRKRPNVPISAKGRFEWILPMGTYLLYHTPSIDPPLNEPFAAFRVSDGSGPIDLGELHIFISVDRPLGSELATYTLLDVETFAANDKTAGWFLHEHPGTHLQHRANFVVDPALRDLFRNWSREACERILSKHGMIIDNR